MNKKQIAITLGVMCFLLTIAICVQLRTMSSASSTVSQTLEDNGLRDEVLRMKEKYDNAYKELEESGYIYSVVGKGSFVAEQNMEMIRERKLKIIEEQLQAVIENSKDLGIPLDELQQLLKILYEE